MCALVLALADSRAAERQAQPADVRAQRAAGIIRDLESPDLRTIAWAAFDAGRYNQTDAAAALLRLLANAPAPLDRERWALVDIVLDSLIQLHARVPAAEIVKFSERRPVQTLVLLATATDREPVLVDLLPTVKSYEWYAAANILVLDKSPGLATHLFRNVHLALTIVVSERDAAGVGAGTFGSGVSDGIGENPRGFPPHVQYRFEGTASPGFVVLAPGPRPVYFSRIVTTEFQYPVSFPGIAGPTDDDRLDYLRALSGTTTSGSPLRADTTAWARWTTAKAYPQRVAELRGDLERRYEYLQSSVIRATGLSPDAATPPHIEIRIEDRRADRSVPLPAIPR